MDLCLPELFNAIRSRKAATVLASVLLISACSGRPNSSGSIEVPNAPGAITSDGVGNVWFTECDATIANVNEASHKVSTFNTSLAKSCGGSLALDRNRTAMWFTDYRDNKIGSIDLLSHEFHVYTIPTRDSDPSGIAAGPDNAMWFTESGYGRRGKPQGRIGRIDLSHHTIDEYELPYGNGNASPFNIALGSDGAFWYTDYGIGGIGRITTDHHITFYRFRRGEYPVGITSGPNGTLWFTFSDAYSALGYVGRLDPRTLRVAWWKAPLPPKAFPEDIVARGSDLWFTSHNYPGITCIKSTSHQFINTHVGKFAKILAITVGSDDRLWFTDPDTNTLGYIAPRRCAE